MTIASILNSSVEGAEPYSFPSVYETMVVSTALAQLGGGLIGRSISLIGHEGLSLKQLSNIALGCTMITGSYFSQAIAGKHQNATLVATLAVVNAGIVYKISEKYTRASNLLSPTLKALIDY